MREDEIQSIVEDRVRSVLFQALSPFQTRIEALEQSTARRPPHPIKMAFDDHFDLYNATGAVPTKMPRGSIVMVDAGTTPNRVIALYLSAGTSMVEIFAKVI